jgi:predicted alpha/beta superfamily hydrolase
MRVLPLLLSSILTASLLAQRYQDVTFQWNATISSGESVYLLGNLDELGASNLSRSMRMSQPSTGTWQLTVRLPANRAYSYSFYRRSNTMALVGNPAHGTLLNGPTAATTAPCALSPASKRVLAVAALPGAQIHWRQDSGAWQQAALTDIGAGRTAAERLWEGWVGSRLQAIDFYLTDVTGVMRMPPVNWWTTQLDAVFMQDNEQFTYLPAASVPPLRRDYVVGSLPAIQSTILGESRPYRVILPRGYDVHTSRRYPVLYWHDGPWMWDLGSPYYFPANQVFDLGAGGVAQLVRSGAVGECIMVAIDWGSNDPTTIANRRARDYLPPGSGYDYGSGWIAGAANNYAAFVLQELKPVIDANYRTFGDREHTFVAGLSFGGIAAAYFGWDYSAWFSRIGCYSPSFWVQSFPQRVTSEALRPGLRWYLDSGNDNYSETEAVRTNWISRAQPYGLERELRYYYAPGQQHVLPDFATRLGRLTTFLYPATDEPNEFLVGAVPYGQGSGPAPLALSWQPTTPQQGAVTAIATPAMPWTGFGAVALAPGNTQVFGIDVLVSLSPEPILLPLAGDPAGVSTTLLNLNQPALLGQRLFVQVIRLDATGLSASNGLELDLGY